jgi:hypothetical protein
MARIRTIKPEFFKDYKLWKAEDESKLPLRTAYSGLWCQCDREGRFEWIPEQLKIEVLPYDKNDFLRVLDALVTRGFVQKYESNGEVFGCIPSFKRHQVINNKERPSELPEPPEINTLTRDHRVDDAKSTRDERVTQGREGKGTSNTYSLNAGDRNPKVGLAELSAGHVAEWLAEKRAEGRYVQHDAAFVLEKFKDYCKSKNKKYDDYIAAYRNAFDWERCQPTGEKNGNTSKINGQNYRGNQAPKPASPHEVWGRAWAKAGGVEPGGSAES